jgi:hypothetical protein
MRISTVLLLFLTACIGEPRLHSQRELIHHFQQHKPAFDRLVTDWQLAKLNGSFRYDRLESKTVRWNYRIVLTDKFDNTANLEGINKEQLQALLDAAKTLEINEISTIGQALPEPKRYLQIEFRGSEREPYGLIYVPTINESEYQWMLAQVDQPKPDPYKKIVHLDERWFYFEARL